MILHWRFTSVLSEPIGQCGSRKSVAGFLRHFRTRKQYCLLCYFENVTKSPCELPVWYHPKNITGMLYPTRGSTFKERVHSLRFFIEYVRMNYKPTQVTNFLGPPKASIVALRPLHREWHFNVPPKLGSAQLWPTLVPTSKWVFGRSRCLAKAPR